jgi:hypothetical protein
MHTAFLLIGGNLGDRGTRSNAADSQSTPPPDKFDVIACQGNTFDFFLGDLQKWFALTLFRKKLTDRGVLFMTQKSFAKGESKVERKVPGPGRDITIIYDLEWSGDFVRIAVRAEDRHLGSVLQHPTHPAWLVETCLKAGFGSVGGAKSNLPRWFGPRGGQPYDIHMFQLKENE